MLLAALVAVGVGVVLVLRGIDVLIISMLGLCIMGTFLKIFFGIILLVFGLLFAACSPFAAIFFGGVGFIVQVIVVIALIAGAITLFIKARG